MLDRRQRDDLRFVGVMRRYRRGASTTRWIEPGRGLLVRAPVLLRL